MANAVDAAVDEGKVVDEYFSFIYEEPTDDTFSLSSEKELNDFVFDEGATIQSTKNEEDPIYENATLRDAAYWEGVNGDARVNGKSKDEECHTSNVTQTGAAGVMPKEPGAQNFSSVFKDANNGVEAERLKPDQVTGVNLSCGDIITPVSINVTPSLLSANTTALTPSHNSSTTYIGNGGNDAGGSSGGKSVINLSAAHLPTTSTSRPEVLKDLESEPPHHDNQEDFQAPSSSSVGSQSIYVNGGGGERDNTWNAKATSVYLNGTEEESVEEFPVPGGVVPPSDTNAHVTIKVSVHSSPSFSPLLGNREEQTPGIMDPDFGKFLEEMQQPPKGTVGGRERGDGASLRDARPGSASVCQVNKSSDVSELDKSALCGKGDLVCDFVSGGAVDNKNKVLDIGSIECDILDEIFEGIRVKKESGEMENYCQGKDNDMVAKVDDRSSGNCVMSESSFFNLVPSTNIKWNENESVMNNEEGVEMVVPNEECSETLVESWQYVAGVVEEGAKGKENNDVGEMMEMAAKPVAQERAIGCGKDSPAITNHDNSVHGKLPVESAGPFGNMCTSGELDNSTVEGAEFSDPHRSSSPSSLSKVEQSNEKGFPVSSSSSVPENSTTPAVPSAAQQDHFILPLPKISTSSSPLSLSPEKSFVPSQNLPSTSASSLPSKCPSLPSPLRVNHSHVGPPPSLQSSNNVPPPSPSPVEVHLPSPNQTPSPPSLDTSLSLKQNSYLSLSKDTIGSSSQTSPSSSFLSTPSPFPQSPSSPSPSTHHHSLSSLPPNLAHSPSSLSSNQPSLELPEILTPTPTTSDYFPDTGCERSDDYSWQEVGGAVGGEDSWQPHRRHSGGCDANSSMEAGATCDFLDESDDDAGGARGLAAAVSRVVRRSMRRMRRLRLSGRRQSPSRTRSPEGAEGVSEETEGRRDLPVEPSMGLATVRSPAAATIIVTSLVAALAPPPLQGPRELLDPPPQLTPTHNRQTDPNQTDQTNGASRRHPRRQRRPWGGGRDGRRRDGGGGGGGDRRGSYDLPLDSSVSPTAPMSLEVEVGGYSPSAPLSLDYSGSSTYSPNHHLHQQSIHSAGRSSSISPSAPHSLDLMVPTSENSWIAAAVIPRPSITSSSSHHHHHPHGRRSHSLPVIQSQSIASPSSSSTTDTPSHSSNVPPSTSSGSRNEESGPSEGDGVGPRSPRSRSHGVGNGGGGGGGEGEASTSTSTSTSAPTRNVADRRRSRTRGNTANDTNNNNSNSNNNNNTRNYTTTDTTSGTTPPNNNRNRNGNNNNTRNNNARQNTRRRPRAASEGLSFEAERLRVQGGTWTHNQSGLMASLAVTVTTFNISRFAVLGAKFGWPFVVQWVVISMVLGLPLMTFHVTVGQYLGAGVVDMWRISPIFQGVGYSLVVAQALVGVYCCVPIAWLFIFFRDSFITHNNMFRWGDCRLVNCSVYNNFSTIIIEGVPKYFSSQVLQRSSVETSWLQELGSIKFDMAVNIALIWVITLIALSRGNQSYGRVAYVVFLLPLLGFLVVCLYLASWTKDDIYINHATNFNELFKTSQSWMAASREVFLVWGFHGSVLQQMSAHNKKGHPLYRDTTVLAVITTLALVLAAVTGSSCVSGLHQNKLYYKPSSFENAETAQFLSETKFQQEIDLSIFKHFPMVNNIPPQLLADYMHYDNFYTGIRIRPRAIGNSKNSEENERSGYQSLRLATELFPALLAVNGAQQISPFWSSLLYFSLLLFGIGQQLAVWRTVIEAVIRINRERLQSWEIFITFLCCLFGFSAALPMATGAGIQILYFLDYVVSCGWWLMIIQLVQIFALLFVRGKPYSGQDIVAELMGKSEQCRSLWLGPLTSFAWNIIVPVGLLVLSISSFKSGQYKDVFAWGNSSYWPVWARQLASALQLFPILLVPLVGLIQICRYLTASDDDLFEKIQLLYRPSLRQRTSGNNSFATNPDDSDVEGPGSPQEGQEEETVTPRPYSDPPPKYTPPPSYSTATGVRFAKLLNQSLRQSMRRLRDTIRSGSEVNATRDTEGTVQSNSNCNGPEGSTSRRNTPYIPPPDYVTVVGEYRTRPIPNRPTTDPPPMYSTLDPLRRRALAAMANATTSTSHVKSDAEIEIPRSTTPTLQRNSSERGSGLRRSIASGVRHSARRLAATFGVGNGEDDSTLVNSEEPLSQDTQPTRDPEESHPHAYTNLEMVSQSEA